MLDFAHLVAARGLRMAVERNRYETEGMHTKSLAQVNAEAATSLSHLMKKCELKPVGSGTATAAFGEVAT